MFALSDPPLDTCALQSPIQETVVRQDLRREDPSCTGHLQYHEDYAEGKTNVLQREDQRVYDQHEYDAVHAGRQNEQYRMQALNPHIKQVSQGHDQCLDEPYHEE